MKTVLVTGGNRGIGLEICRQLDSAGHRVILCSRDPAAGLEAAKRLSPAVIVRPLDVTDEDSIQELYHFVSAEFGHLDVLINNAGVGSSQWDSNNQSGFREKMKNRFHGLWKMARLAKPILEKIGLAGHRETAMNMDLLDARMIMEVNFYGPWSMIQVFAPLLEKSKDGRIINISSGMGALDRLNGESPGYSLSKAALNALTIMFSRELLKTNIKVNAICPGWVKTRMGGPDAPRDVNQGADTAVWLSTAEEIPTGKFFRDRNEISW